MTIPITLPPWHSPGGHPPLIRSLFPLKVFVKNLIFEALDNIFPSSIEFMWLVHPVFAAYGSLCRNKVSWGKLSGALVPDSPPEVKDATKPNMGARLCSLPRHNLSNIEHACSFTHLPSPYSTQFEQDQAKHARSLFHAFPD